MPRFGEKVDLKHATNGAPPLVFQIQPTAYIKVDQPKDLKNWEEDVRRFYGLKLSATPIAHACYTCSGGCCDDCGQVEEA